MVFKRFSILLFIQIIILASLIAAGFWALGQPHLAFTKYGFFGLALLQLGYILHFTNRNNQEIYKFLSNFIINESFPRFKNHYKDKTFQKIEIQLNRIAESYGQVKLEKESEHQFLQYTLEHLDAAILVANEDEKVILSNSKANELFQRKIIELKDLNLTKEGLYQKVNETTPGNPEIVRLYQHKFSKPYSIKITQFSREYKTIRIISFNDIDRELAREELKSWQTLIRILRHEIINSITPITTLAGAMNDNYSDDIEIIDDDSPESKLLSISKKGFAAIEKRGKGLLEFVDRFKTISGMPEPEKKQLLVKDLFIEIRTLFTDELKKESVQLAEKISDSDIEIHADEKLVMQTLINLTKNAIQAVQNSENKKIELSAQKDSFGHVLIAVKDTGIGIAEENLDNIFVPFFTTKDDGSGIGLSFVKQVMYKHGGFVDVQSKVDQYTCFEITFPV